MPNSCYLCGANGSNPLALPKTFTAHSMAKCPDSKTLCDRCYAAIDGTEKQLWYWNEGKGKWSALWGRSLSRLYQGEKLISPIINGEHTESGKTFPIVSDLPTRAQMRDWILNPPEPPFTIAIAESGQKHILPWAQEGHDRDYFPVQFELDCVWIRRLEFTELLSNYEALMALGFSKTEIDSGDYHSDRLMRAISQYGVHESIVCPYRGSRLLTLASYIAKDPRTAAASS